MACLDVTDLRAPELQQEILGFTLTHARRPTGRAKIRILRAVDRARKYIPLRAIPGSSDCRRVGSIENVNPGSTT
jgi:hypothetical protein